MASACIAIFAGPSLPLGDRSADPRLTFFAPAARGDVLRAANDFEAILLIDGVFHERLAPTPKEIRAVCARRRFFGAASMGALRATECRPYGARGIGAIAGWYAHEVIDGDDEVAVLMHPQSFAALSVPSVNVRHVARLAVRRGILTRAAAADWIAAARFGIYYAERSWSAAVALAHPETRPALAAIAESCGDLKRLDASFAQRRMLRLLEHRHVAA